MELTAVLGAMAQPAGDPEIPDARDPATAAAFTALLAGLVAPPPVATPETPEVPAPERTDAGPTPATDSDLGASGRLAGSGFEPGAALPGPSPSPTGGASATVTTGTSTEPATSWSPAAAGATPSESAAPARESGHPSVATAPTIETDRSASFEPTEPSNRPLATLEPTEPTVPSTGPLATLESTEPTEPSNRPLATLEPTEPSNGPLATLEPTEPTEPSNGPLATGPAGLTPPAEPPAPTTIPDPTGRRSAEPAADRPIVPAPAPASATTSTTGSDARSAAEQDDGASARDRQVAAPSVLAEGTVPAAQAITTTTVTSVEVPGARSLERVLAMQLVERIGTLRAEDDGVHELSLQLDPADLGPVELRVRIDAGVVHVQVGAQSAGTTDLVRRAIPELREALAEAGLTAGFLDVGTHSGQPHAHTSGARQDPLPHAAASPSSPVQIQPTTVRTTRVDADGLDVLL